MPKRTYARQRAADKQLRERYQALGIVRTAVWVPESRKQELKELTRAWRDELKGEN